VTPHDRATREVVRLVASYIPSRLPYGAKAEVTRLMEAEPRRHGMASLRGSGD